MDPAFNRFADACTWPDHPRTRSTEHYVNLPRDAVGLGPEPCPGAEVCVVTAIADDLEVLASPAAGETERLAALKYLGHWVGDIHQPLHVSFADDRGGSDMAVTGLCSGTLHHAWDGCLIERSLGQDTQAVAAALHAEISDAERATWIASTPLAMANEFFAIAISPTIRYCLPVDDGCWYEAATSTFEPGEPVKTVTIGAEYLDAAALIIRQRLKQAGVRLAHLLDQALGTGELH